MRSAWELPVRPRDPASVEGSVRAILRQAQFRPPDRTLPQRVWHWIATELNRLFSHLGIGGGFGIPPVVILAILVILMLVVVALIVRRGSWRGFGRRPKKSPAVMVSADDLGVASETWLQRAEAAEAGGDWKEGLRCRYRALVAVLVAAGAVNEEIGRTAGEYRALVDRTLADAAAPFSTATDIFEETWYGNVASGPNQRNAVMAAVVAVTDAARKYRQARRAVRAGEPATVGSGTHGSGTHGSGPQG